VSDFNDVFGPAVAANEVYMHQVPNIFNDVAEFSVEAVVLRYDDAGNPPPETCMPFGAKGATVTGPFCEFEYWSAPSSPVPAPHYMTCPDSDPNCDASKLPIPHDDSACTGWVPADSAHPDGPFVFKP
jgi:hypothetical protein